MQPQSDSKEQTGKKLQEHPIIVLIGAMASLVAIIGGVIALLKPNKIPININGLTSEKGVKYELLKTHLENSDFKAADEQTNRMLRQVFDAEGDRYVPKEHIAQDPFPCKDLANIDYIWGQLGKKNQFGFKPQVQIWESLGSAPTRNKDTFLRFADRVGWRDASKENQFRTRDTLIYSLSAPDGHLPSGIGTGLRWAYGRFLNRTSQQCNF